MAIIKNPLIIINDGGGGEDIDALIDGSLTEIISNATSVRNYAFAYYSTLTSANFPSAISLGSYAFEYCAGLVSINLPLTRTIGSSAFIGCSALTSITLGYNDVCSIGNLNAIPANSSHHVTIYVPANLIDSYKVATLWSTHYNNGYISFYPIAGTSFNITTSVINGSYSGATTIVESGTATVTLAASSGYDLPSSITVTGASYTYDSTTGVVSLSSPTGNITITAVCTQPGSGYTVIVSSINESPWGEAHAYYSTDNGTTWTEITTSGLLTSNATQVKFRVVTNNYAMEGITISSATLGLNISNGDNGENVDSSNYTLSGDVTDIVVNFIDND